MMRRTRLALASVVTVTVVAWAFLCFGLWRHLVKIAADSPELYTRGSGFQALNFVVQYLAPLTLLLAAAIGVEWAMFRLAGWVRRKVSAHAG